MKILAAVLATYAIGILIVSRIIDTKLAETVDDACRFQGVTTTHPAIVELRESARRAKISYGLAVGSALALVVATIAWFID